jgi:hypothetical protein
MYIGKIFVPDKSPLHCPVRALQGANVQALYSVLSQGGSCRDSALDRRHQESHLQPETR